MQKFFEKFKGRAKYYITSSFGKNGNKFFYLFEKNRFNEVKRKEIKEKLKNALKNYFSNIKILDDKEEMFVYELDSTSSRKAVEPFIKNVFNKE